MSIPNPLDEGATREALQYFSAAGFEEIDTAIMYQGGKSETTLGDNAHIRCADIHSSVLGRFKGYTARI